MMKFSKSFESEIKKCMVQKSENVDVPENMFKKIEYQIKNQKGEMDMNKKLKLKKVAIVVAACMAIAGTAIASQKISSWTSVSSDISKDSKVEDFESVQKLEEKLGYSPKYTKSLPNGFEFKSASISTSNGKDADGNLVTQSNRLSIYYDRENRNENEYLSFSISNINKSIFNQDLEYSAKTHKSIQYNNLTLYYNETKYKFVPEDYELTEQDKKDMEAQVLQISVGSEEIEYSTIQSIQWYDDDNQISYLLMGSDTELTQEQMVEMAKTIIDK